MTAMQGYQVEDFTDTRFSVAMTESIDQLLTSHLNKGRRQEDLTFAYWRPSRGLERYTAVLHEVVLPEEGDRILQGNVAFTAQYLKRVLRDVPAGCGIALLHSHLGPGWQGMSNDDIVAERDRMGGAVASRTKLPVLGLTWGTDGTWSARFWVRSGTNQYDRRWAETVRVVGHRLRMSHHPELSPDPARSNRQVATVSVWGHAAQADVVRTHVGIVGLGSVGSILNESLARTGIQRITLVDHDVLEDRNLDRTLGAIPQDVERGIPKVTVAARLASTSHTSPNFKVIPVEQNLLTASGLAHTLDCDVLMSCVDRPLPRHLLNVISKAHLIPVVDGGILARVSETHGLVHLDWRIHTVGPERACLHCLGALRRSDVALDKEGLLDDPDYIKNLPERDRELIGRRNVFAFSLSVAAHQTLQFVGLVTGVSKVGGKGPQHYSAYPGRMDVEPVSQCEADCDIESLTASALDLTSNLQPDRIQGAPQVGRRIRQGLIPWLRQRFSR